MHHLQVAQHVFAQLGGATVVPLNVSALPVLRLAYPAASVTAS